MTVGKMTLTDVEKMLKRMREVKADYIEFDVSAGYDCFFGDVTDVGLDIDFMRDNDEYIETHYTS